ncbi:MAG: hypothetical protein HKP61_19135 [Dactylosporangium sp.]|nr:hypothetical protein [Dactylosporangium sp.]
MGSLPAAVYWRRRALVVALPLAAAAVAWFSLSGTDEPAKRRSAVAIGASADPAVSTSAPLLTPTVEEPPPSSPATVPVAPAGAGNPTEACADAELLVTPVPETSTVSRGQGMKLGIKIKNVSSRTCVRDLGADAQELYLLQGDTKVYSSDACDSRHGVSVRTLSPGEEQVFTLSWDGTSTAAGCAGRQPPPAGGYQLVGRLGEKTSDPVPVTLN